MNARYTSSKDEKERAVASMACEAYSRDTQIEFILGKKRPPPGHDFDAKPSASGTWLAVEVTGFHAFGNAPGIFSPNKRGFLNDFVTDLKSRLRGKVKGAFWIDLGLDTIPQMCQSVRAQKISEIQQAVRNAAANMTLGQKVSLGPILGARDFTLEKLSEDDAPFGWSLAGENVNWLNIQNNSVAEFCDGTLKEKNENKWQLKQAKSQGATTLLAIALEYPVMAVLSPTKLIEMLRRYQIEGRIPNIEHIYLIDLNTGSEPRPPVIRVF